MREFIVAVVILFIIISAVVFFTVFAEVNINKIYASVEASEDARGIPDTRRDYEKILPILTLIAPDDLIYEIDSLFIECENSENAWKIKKSRLLLGLNELRRLTGMCPIAIL